MYGTTWLKPSGTWCWPERWRSHRRLAFWARSSRLAAARGLGPAGGDPALIGTPLWPSPTDRRPLASPRLGGSASGLDDIDTIEVLNLVAAIGGAVLVAAGLLAVVTVLRSTLSPGPAPGDDPWNGHTLEWATSSPPPVGNFASLPEITSEAPLYDARYAPTAADPEASA